MPRSLVWQNNKTGTHFKKKLCQSVTSRLSPRISLYHQQLVQFLLYIKSVHEDCHVRLKFAVIMPNGVENCL